MMKMIENCQAGPVLLGLRIMQERKELKWLVKILAFYCYVAFLSFTFEASVTEAGSCYRCLRIYPVRFAD